MKTGARRTHCKSHNIFHPLAIQARFSDGPQLLIPVLSKDRFTIFTKIITTVVLYLYPKGGEEGKLPSKLCKLTNPPPQGQRNKDILSRLTFLLFKVHVLV